MIRRRVVAAGGGLAALAVAVVAVAQTTSGQYDLSFNAITGGGGRSTNGNLALDGAIGQPVAGVASGGSYTVNGGLLGGGVPKYTRLLPLLASDGQ